jgi:hypothetical protein
MHPEIAKALVSQRHDELVHDTAAIRRGPSRRRFPRWHVSWTRTILSPAGHPAPAVAGHSGTAHSGTAHSGTRRSSRASRVAARRGSSLVIIISAHRSA